MAVVERQNPRDTEGIPQNSPLVPGMDMEELRGKLPYGLSAKIFRTIIDALVSDKAIAKEENLLRTTDHRVQLGSQEKSLMDRIKNILGEQPISPPELKEIEKQLAVSRNKLTEVLRFLGGTGRWFEWQRISSIYRAPSIRCAPFLKSFSLKKTRLVPPHFAISSGPSRKYTIPLLEYFDREGVTIRIGDVRRLSLPPPRRNSTPQ